MPQMNLSALSGQELRRLLDASRARGDAPLAYQILQEMAERREVREARGRSSSRRSAEPRVVALNLGDPAEPDDDVPPMPNWRAPTPEPEIAAVAPPAPSPQPGPRRSRQPRTSPPVVVAGTDVEPPPEPPRPRSVWDDDGPASGDAATGADDLRLHLERPTPASRRQPRRFRGPPGAGFAAGVAVGAALGWWATGALQPAPSSPAAPAAIPIQTAALDPPPAPATLPVTVAAEPAPPLETLPEPTGGPLPPGLPEGPQPSPDAGENEPDAAVEPSEPAPTLVRATHGGDGACAAEPTPADREICGDPELRRLQRELRQAYAEALAAHEDRDLLRQRQLAWRDARNTVAEPDRLARLYEQRIRKLNAATAEARQQR